jgi:hypothetical protein
MGLAVRTDFDNYIGPAFLVEMAFLPGVLQSSMAPAGAAVLFEASPPEPAAPTAESQGSTGRTVPLNLKE